MMGTHASPLGQARPKPDSVCVCVCVCVCRACFPPLETDQPALSGLTLGSRFHPDSFSLCGHSRPHSVYEARFFPTSQPPTKALTLASASEVTPRSPLTPGRRKCHLHPSRDRQCRASRRGAVPDQPAPGRGVQDRLALPFSTRSSWWPGQPAVRPSREIVSARKNDLEPGSRRARASPIVAGGKHKLLHHLAQRSNRVRVLTVGQRSSPGRQAGNSCFDRRRSCLPGCRAPTIHEYREGQCPSSTSPASRTSRLRGTP